MSAIKGKDTQPELLVRKALHQQGLRYRLHVRGLAGTPDLVFPRYKTVVFVHGCFWHQHGCSNSRTPETRKDFWTTKLRGNKERDDAQVKLLLEQGWRVAVVWECSVKQALRSGDPLLLRSLGYWIMASKGSFAEF
jgi:DNA mismatch endonuclease, patch repair protein